MQRELIEQAARGDQEAFATLASQHVDRCYALAYRILRDPDRAHDATQQALLGAWRDLATLRDPDSLRSVALSAGGQRLLRRIRRHRRWLARMRVSVDEPVVPDLAKTVADRDLLEQAFRALTPEQRALVVLHHQLGYSARGDRGHARDQRRRRAVPTPSRRPADAGGHRCGHADRRDPGATSMMPTTPSTFDRRIADWLAGDPNEAPETVMSAVIAALPTVRSAAASPVRSGGRRARPLPRRLPDKATAPDDSPSGGTIAGDVAKRAASAGFRRCSSIDLPATMAAS